MKNSNPMAFSFTQNIQSNCNTHYQNKTKWKNL